MNTNAPEGLEEAIAQAMNELDLLPGRSIPLAAEAMVQSEAIGAWVETLRATDATEKGQDAREPRESLQVVCTVTVPLSSPHAAADALSRVPINAAVRYDDKPQGILAGVFGIGALIAQWTEER